MKTLHYFLIFFFSISIINISNAHDSIPDNDNNQLLINLLKKENEDLKKVNAKQVTTIADKDAAFQKIHAEKKATDIRYKQLEDSYNALQNTVNDYDKISKRLDSIEAEIPEKDKKIRELNKHRIKSKYDALKIGYDTLKTNFEKQGKELERLGNIEKAKNTLETELATCKTDRDTKGTEIELLNGKVSDLNKKVEEKEAALTAFKGFKDEAIKTIKSEIPVLVVSDKFYVSDEKIADYEKTIAMIRNVVGPKDKELNDLERKLKLFKKSSEILKSTKVVLEEIYNKNKVNNAIKKLETFNNADNPHFNKEKERILHLLKNYCRCYQEAYSLFDGLKNYNGKSGQARLVSNDIGYFRVYKESKSQIYIYDEYPYLQQIINQREKSPTNTSITLPPISCN